MVRAIVPTSGDSLKLIIKYCENFGNQVSYISSFYIQMIMDYQKNWIMANLKKKITTLFHFVHKFETLLLSGKKFSNSLDFFNHIKNKLFWSSHTSYVLRHITSSNMCFLLIIYHDQDTMFNFATIYFGIAKKTTFNIIFATNQM